MEQLEKYERILNDHLNLYPKTILQATHRYLSEQFVTFFGPEESTTCYPKWYSMSNARMHFILDWLIRNEIFVRAHNVIGKSVTISLEDSDNFGEHIQPKDSRARELYRWLNEVELNTRMWYIDSVVGIEIWSELQRWYRKLHCIKLKMDNGFYKGTTGQMAWNRCINMLRIQYIVMAVIQETERFMEHVDDLLDKRSVRPSTYKWDRSLLYAYKEARAIYLNSSERINHSEDEEDDWDSETMSEDEHINLIRIKKIASVGNTIASFNELEITNKPDLELIK